MQKVIYQLDYQNLIHKDAKSEDALVLWIVATHTDMPINNRIYKRDEVEKAVETWLKPYNKPVLVHHDNLSDAVGRVLDAVYIPAEDWSKVKELTGKEIPLPDGSTGAILLKVIVTDKNAAQKVRGGIYKSVSIGFDAEKLLCNICGTDWNISPCKHQPGAEYDGKTMYLIPHNIKYLEISFVNVPADEHAMVITMEDIDEDTAQKLLHSTTELKTDEDQEVTMTTEEIQVNKDNKTVSDDNEAGVPEREDDSIDGKGGQKDMDAKIDALQKENDELKAKIKELSDELEKLRTENEQLSKFKDQYEKLHELTKSFLLDEIITHKEMLSDQLGVEFDAEAVRKEYENLSIDELNLLRKELGAIVDKMIDSLEEDVEEGSEDEEPEKETEEVENKDEAQEIKRVDMNEPKEENKDALDTLLIEVFKMF